MGKCVNCGSALEHADRFCKNCGPTSPTLRLHVPPQVSSGQQVPMVPGSPLLFNVPTVQGRSGFSGAISRGVVSPQTPVPPGIIGGVLTPLIAVQPMQPLPSRTNNYGSLGLLAREQLYEPRNQLSSDGMAVATLVEVDVLYERMSDLAKQFLDLFDAIPRAGLERKLSGKAFRGLVMSRVDMYKDPSTWKKSDSDHLDPGKVIRVFAEKTDGVSASSQVWYRISRRFPSPRYIFSESVINLYQMLQRYFELATQLWEAVAANHFEEVINPKATFQDDVKKLEEQLKWLLEGCSNAKQNPQAKGSLRWRRRIGLYRRALEIWRHCLDEKPSTMYSDSTECGRILYRAWGYLGLGSCNWFEYILIKSLQMLGVLISRLLVLFLPIFMIDSAVDLSFPQKIVYSLVVLLVSFYLLWFSAKEPSLSVMIGYTLMRKQAQDAILPVPESKASSQNSSPFQPFLRSYIRIRGKLRNFLLRWWLRLGLGEVPGEGKRKGRNFLLRWWLRLGGVVGAAFLLLILYLVIFSPPFGLQGVDLIAFSILLLSFCWLLAFLCIVLPFTLKVQEQMRRELKDHHHRPPEARRSAVLPAVKLLSFHAIIVLITAIVVLNSVPAFKFRAADVPLGSLTVNLVHQIAYLLVVVWLYWRYLGKPYRRGLRHWKTRRLGELATLRTRLDRRLSQTPSSFPVEKESSSVQDDYTRWQYYCALEEEVKGTSSGPFTLVQRGGGLLILISAVLSGIITNPTIVSQVLHWIYSIPQLILNQ